MNYTYVNRIFDYYSLSIEPFLSHHFSVVSLEDYLKRLSYVSHGRWLRDPNLVRMTTIALPIDPEKLVKLYSNHCVTYNTPIKQEDGYRRAIYQVSPTLHFEASFWFWIEQEILQSYASVIVCYNNNNKKEFDDFVEVMIKNRRTGNTEDKVSAYGFTPIPSRSTGAGFAG